MDVLTKGSKIVNDEYPKLIVEIREWERDGLKHVSAGVKELILSEGVKVSFWGHKIGEIHCSRTKGGWVCKTEWEGDEIKPIKEIHVAGCGNTAIWPDKDKITILTTDCGCVVEKTKDGYRIFCGKQFWNIDPKSLLPFKEQLKLDDVKFEVEKVEEKKVGDRKIKIITYRAKKQ